MPRVYTQKAGKDMITETAKIDAIMALIAKRLAAPKQFRVVTTFADGRTRIHETETEGQAKNHAVGERRKIGRDLISRDTGAIVRVVSVVVERI